MCLQICANCSWIMSHSVVIFLKEGVGLSCWKEYRLIQLNSRDVEQDRWLNISICDGDFCVIILYLCLFQCFSLQSYQTNIAYLTEDFWKIEQWMGH